MNIKSLFGENASYVAAFLVLIGIASATPSIVSTFTSPTVSAESTNTAAVINSTFANKDGSVKFPAGYTCTPNPSPASGVTAKVTGDPKLVLTYDSNNKEALLTAKFNVTVDGGKNGVYVYQYPFISFRDALGNYSYSNTQRNLPLLPVSKLDKKTDSYGQEVYWVAPNKQAKFIAIGSVNPKSLLSGSYTASLDVMIGESSLTNPVGFKIIVNQNQTNSKTIIGETSPYISYASPYQANVGDKVDIYGQRLNSGTVYVDGVVLSGVTIGSSLDGTALWFSIPSSIPVGWHIVTVGNSEGISNGVGLEVLSTSSMVRVLSPNGGEALFTGKSYPISWTSSKPVQIDLERKLPTDSQFWNIGTIATNQPASGSYNWNVSAMDTTGKIIADAQYKIIVGSGFASGDGLADESDDYFTISTLTCPVGYVCTTTSTGIQTAVPTVKQ